ncbi:putative PMT_2 domain-containing protein [Azospirillaceae bacterium]
MRIGRGVNRLFTTVVVFLALAFLTPLLIQYAPSHQVGWDDAFYLHRAACVNHGVFSSDLVSLSGCFADIHKSPMMAFWSLPWGEQAATEDGAALGLVTLTFVMFVVVIAIIELLVLLAVPRLLILLASIGLFFTPLPWSVVGVYQGDVLISLLTTLLLLLIPLELHAPEHCQRSSVARGVFWGLIFSVGVMTRPAFGVLVVLSAPMLIALRWRRVGARTAIITTFVAVLVSSPAIVYLLVYWNELSGYAINSAGLISKYASYGLDWKGYLNALVERLGLGVIFFMAIGFIACSMLISRHMSHSFRAWRGQEKTAHLEPPIVTFLRFYPFLLLELYLGLTALSVNHDMRYALPFVFGLPFVAASIAIDPKKILTQKFRRFDYMARVAISVAAAVLLSVPMSNRLDLRYVQIAEGALAALPSDRPMRVMMASDDRGINSDTLQLARQLNIKRFHHLTIDTVVYDVLRELPLAWSLDRLVEADAVVMLKKTPLLESPDWTNQFSVQFREYLTKIGARKQDDPTGFLEIWRIEKHGPQEG